MLAVWSFWSKPFQARAGSEWASPKHHLLSWILSVECARRHYVRTALVTDDDGARLLIDELGLGVSTVSTRLNALGDIDPRWWSLGKLHAYRMQQEPFVHIDNDVFLWKPLPRAVESAPVFAQNPEYVRDYSYCPAKFDVMREAGGWVADEVAAYDAAPDKPVAVCCGIVGGRYVEFIRHYADTAIRLIEHPANRHAWELVGIDPILVEQFVLLACLSYHRRRAGSRFEAIDIEYLFDSFGEAFSRRAAAQAGYTHLIAGAKKNAALVRHLEERVMHDYPEHYERCMRYVARERAPARMVAAQG